MYVFGVSERPALFWEFIVWSKLNEILHLTVLKCSAWDSNPEPLPSQESASTIALAEQLDE
jgi:hypothetical protein